MTEPENQPSSQGRIVAGVVAAVILVLAVWCFKSSLDRRRLADAARVAEPIHLKVDLSKPGVYSGEFRHTFTFACSDYFQIVPESPLSSQEKAEAIVKGLQGRFSIAKPDGLVVYERSFGPSGFGAIEVEENRWIPTPGRDHFGFAEGVYVMKLTVEQGAPALAGVPHAIVGRYMLCGIEYMPAQFLMLAGIGGCVVAGIIVLVIAVVCIKKRRPPASLDSSEKA